MSKLAVRDKSDCQTNKKEEILEAAAKLFRAKGFDGTSMQDIGSAVGILRGSIYHHFASKEEIFYEVISKGVDRLLAGAEPIRAENISAREKLRALVKNHVFHLINNDDSLVIFSQQRDKLTPQHLDIYVGKRDRYERLFRQTLREGMEKGEFPRLDVSLTVFAILGICNWLIQWYRRSGPKTPEEIAEFMGSIICDHMLK